MFPVSLPLLSPCQDIHSTSHGDWAGLACHVNRQQIHCLASTSGPHKSSTSTIECGVALFQMEEIQQNIRDFKASSGVDKIVVLWTANTERYSDVVEGINDTAENFLGSIDKDEAEVAPSSIFAAACIHEGESRDIAKIRSRQVLCRWCRHQMTTQAYGVCVRSRALGSPLGCICSAHLSLCGAGTQCSCYQHIRRQRLDDCTATPIFDCTGACSISDENLSSRWCCLNATKKPLVRADGSVLAGVPFINGAPQNTFVPGLLEFAIQRKVMIGGDDFKSGQTKMKSVLVDFLVGAGIKPTSIVSYNHLGNNDGMNLSAPQTFRSKEISKSNVVDDMVASNSILYAPGRPPHRALRVSYALMLLS